MAETELAMEATAPRMHTAVAGTIRERSVAAAHGELSQALSRLEETYERLYGSIATHLRADDRPSAEAVLSEIRDLDRETGTSTAHDVLSAYAGRVTYICERLDDLLYRLDV